MQDIKLFVNSLDGTVTNHYNIHVTYSLNKSICDSSKIIDPTPYSSLYTHYNGGFDMNTEKAVKPMPDVYKSTY